MRGAPHAHPPARLDAVRAALAPRASDEGGAAHVAAVEEVAAAFTGDRHRPDAEGRGERRADPPGGPVAGGVVRALRRDHVPEPLFRAGGRQARRSCWSCRAGPPCCTRRRSTRGGARRPPRRLRAGVRAGQRPDRRTPLRDWLGLDAGAVGEAWAALPWREGRGRRPAAPGARGAAWTSWSAPRAARGVVLVPPHDPYLRAGRPHAARAGQGTAPGGVACGVRAGALLVDGEVAGTWRYRRTGRELTVTPFEALTARPAQAGRGSARLAAAASGDDRRRWSGPEGAHRIRRLPAPRCGMVVG